MPLDHPYVLTLSCRDTKGITLSAEDYTAVGRDIECMVLARAVRWHVEHRVLINGHKCVVFR